MEPRPQILLLHLKQFGVQACRRQQMRLGFEGYREGGWFLLRLSLCKFEFSQLRLSTEFPRRKRRLSGENAPAPSPPQHRQLLRSEEHTSPPHSPPHLSFP